MTVLHIRAWEKNQAAVLNKVRWAREKRVKDGKASAGSERNPLSINSVSLASVLDERFAAFAEMVGGKMAETYLVRVLQYVANGHALTGDIPVSPSKFGTLVLSREWDIVSVSRGRKVYEALIASGIAEITDGSTRGSTGGSTCDPLPVDSSVDSSVNQPDSRSTAASALADFAPLPFPGVAEASGRRKVPSLKGHAWVSVDAIIDCMCKGMVGKTEQDRGLMLRKMRRANAMGDELGSALLDQYKARFKASIGAAKRAAREGAA